MNSLTISRSLTHTHTHIHTHTHNHSLTHTHTHTHTLSISQTHTHSISLYLTHTHYLSLSLTHKQTHTDSPNLPNTNIISKYKGGFLLSHSFRAKSKGTKILVFKKVRKSLSGSFCLKIEPIGTKGEKGAECAFEEEEEGASLLFFDSSN